MAVTLISGFLNLPNDFLFIASQCITTVKGTIYKYVGDEVIVTWPLEKGIKNAQAIDCFFLIDRVIKKRKSEFEQKYGVVPGFKAGMHCGTVISGELGFTKKEITYMGDVLNTTARIEAECNALQERFLISGELQSRLPNNTHFRFEDHGEFALRGKQSKLRLFSVKPAWSAESKE
ncbi:MAG: adenylate/guanylate cyclase domain-containing protein [Bacteroidota bacterium]